MYQNSGQIVRISKEESSYIWILKCVAIIFVVCAHLYPVPENAVNLNRIASELLHYMGSMGVPVFFMISGYLFAGNQKSFRVFWLGKIKSLFVPWFFCYTLLYLYVILRKGGASLLSYFRMLIGYQSTAYYLTMLIVMYLIFWISSNMWYIRILMIASVFSIICTGWNFGISGLNDLCGTYFLNPLNWIVFFAAGILIRKSGRGLTHGRGIWILLLGGLSIAYMIIMKKLEEPIYYFSKFALIAHIVNIPLLFCIATALSKFKSGLVQCIGKKSFSIYLTHQFVAGAIIAVTNIFLNPVFVLLRPFITVCVVYVGFVIIEKVFWKTKWITTLIGLR